MLLSEYDIQYATHKSIKRSVLSEHLTHQPVEDYQPMQFEFPDADIMVLDNNEGPELGARWAYVFDGDSNAMGHGV